MVQWPPGSLRPGSDVAITGCAWVRWELLPASLLSRYSAVPEWRPHHVHSWSWDGGVWQLETSTSEENVQQADDGRGESWETVIHQEVLRGGENLVQRQDGGEWVSVQVSNIEPSVTIKTNDWKIGITIKLIKFSSPLYLHTITIQIDSIIYSLLKLMFFWEKLSKWK